MDRSAGVLLHISSLPSRFGIGDFGPESDRFVDWLADAGFTWWQVLPLNPPGYGNSPYQPWSAFAGNPLFISPEQLQSEGLLGRRELNELIPSSAGTSDFGRAETVRRDVLERAWNSFTPNEEYRRFIRENWDWIEDAVLFRVIHRKQGRAWTTWPPELRDRDGSALHRFRSEHATELDLERFAQFVFFRQHDRLRRRAAESGIRLVGDIPIFVAHDSADVWAGRELFDLNQDGSPRVVAGVPPDYFSATGQRWGNPLYRWEHSAATGHAWWLDRLAASFRLYDMVRLDHFRGFVAAWEVPAEDAHASGGRWVPGPGRQFFEELRRHMGNALLLAEDLGDITPDVDELREELGLPGMSVLQFGPPDPSSPHLPHNFRTTHRVVYPGTHDNDTTLGWWRTLSTEGKEYLRNYTGRRRLGKRSIVGVMRRLAFGSNADIAVIPMQDLLGLGSEGRMNLPGNLAPSNWSWRMDGDALDRVDPGVLREELRTFGRLPQKDT